VPFVPRLLVLGALAAFAIAPLQARPQSPANRGKLVVTVSDQTGAVIPGATVSVAGLDDAIKGTAISPAKTVANGSATFEGLVPGHYSISAEFEGFDPGLLRDIRVNRGDNKHVVVLPLKNMAESVTVGGAALAADRASRAFGLSVTQEQIEALSDDPAEMQRQLNDIAGPDAIFRIDSFEGQQLPAKSQI
jgi:hypothetical protein